VEAKADAPKRGWHLVDMKEEWATVFSDDRITAVDILLEPDAVMLERAAEMNRRLLGLHPEGFALDSAHRPHVTLLQRFVHTDRLDEVHRAAEAVLARADLAAMRLEANGLYYIPDGDTGVAGIVIRPTPEFTRLQEELIDATAPFTAPSGPSSAFMTTPDDLVINPALIRYVERFTEDSAGEHFNPHVTVGVGPRDELDRMVAQPFGTFFFGVSGAAVYQLGQFGTAARRLHELRAV
jgi:2'-5' RNA ligase